MQELKIDSQNLFVLVDDLALPYGTIRIRGKGSDAGHNGLKSINELMQTQDYPRLRFGIGNDYPKGKQVEYVLGKWNADEKMALPKLLDKSVEAIECYVQAGLAKAMNLYNS